MKTLREKVKLPIILTYNPSCPHITNLQQTTLNIFWQKYKKPENESYKQLKRVETLAKGKNYYEQFLLLSQCFLLRHQKVSACGKWFNITDNSAFWALTSEIGL